MTGADSIISLEGVTKSFANAGGKAPYVAVDNLDLRVEQGQMLAWDPPTPDGATAA